MPLVRSLTLHTGRVDGSREIVDAARKLYECTRRVGLDAWSLRVVVYVQPNNIASLCGQLGKWNIMVHLGSHEPATAIDLVSSCNTYYAATVCRDKSCLSNALTTLYGLARNGRVNPSTFTRYAIIVGEPVVTSYFPATVPSREPILLLAFRYADSFSEILRAPSIRESSITKFVVNALSSALDVAKCIGVGDAVGADLSLSPWMAESVVKVLEEAFSIQFGSPGTIYAIHEANKVLERLAEIVRDEGFIVTGFNEVMLAVAEDNNLNTLVRRGRIRLSDLVSYAAFCVAGVDMVAIPVEDVDPDLLAADVWAVHQVKRRSIGVRVIPVAKPPLTPVQLERFGTTYVARP